MIRLVVVLLVAVLALLAALSLGPRDARTDPVETIDLEAAEVRLFPSADPDAIWRFSAPAAQYDPGRRETTLRSIQDGERRVEDVVDFTLTAEELIIGRDDDLRSARMDVHLVADDLDVEMTGEDGRLVQVNQDAGRFEVPNMRLYGDDFGESRYEEMSVSFDFTDFQAGGPDTIGYSEFQLEEQNEDGS